jgi:hypothetical protein
MTTERVRGMNDKTSVRLFELILVKPKDLSHRKEKSTLGWVNSNRIDALCLHSNLSFRSTKVTCRRLTPDSIRYMTIIYWRRRNWLEIVPRRTSSIQNLFLFLVLLRVKPTRNKSSEPAKRYIKDTEHKKEDSHAVSHIFWATTHNIFL